MHYQLRHVDGLAGYCVKTGGHRLGMHLQVEKDEGMQVCRCQFRDEKLPNHSTNAESAVEAKHMH